MLKTNKIKKVLGTAAVTTQMVMLASFSQVAHAQNYSATDTWSNGTSSLTSCSQSADVVICSLRRAKTVIDGLFPNISSSDYVNDFLPVLNKAQLALDTYNDIGGWPLETRVLILDFIADFEDLQPKIEDLITTPNQNRTARQLLSSLRLIKREMTN